ncbi:PhaM family polyhydroxyalkanoate granule multifunctional regulatory protein [Glaciimonas sp. PCH181]|uniref:PhaM family polyhydroxyalkanoate granule multifunctional regulatory protein n=1 Tax=Glaciimonas sp. PCH181 TaxID=2133943 RepID=UPI000D3AB558|nr:PhaM family polyhydroxyalkanoate granule multifunctional regulatory protein [Glaciimonas sp. PCH181]PUA18217.1 hypothetical protein C7W93_20650 [Glaciimonas sp. PCH181]
MSNPNFPGVNVMSDSVDFIKKMWGGMSIPGMPGMVVPTLSVEEIDKKVADLKAVEGWLSLNLNMLRGTIQGLEVQSATLSALKSIVAISMPTADTKSAPNFGGTSAADSATGGAAAWAAMASQFPFSFMPDKAKASEESTPQPAAAFTFSPPPPPQAEVSPAAESAPLASDSAAGQNAANPQASPTTAWWDVLQNQFQQVVSGVMAAEAKTAKEAAEEAKAAPKPKSSPQSKGATVKADAKTSIKASPKTSTTPKARVSGAAKTTPTTRKKKAVTK